MNMRRKLLSRFILQLFIAGVSILLISGFVLVWMLNQLNNTSHSGSVGPSSFDSLIESAVMDDSDVEFDPELLTQIKESDGWLQVINEEGTVIASYYTPEDVPSHYKPGELIAYIEQTMPFPYPLSIWMREKNGMILTLLYGKKNTPSALLEQIMSEGSIVSKELTLPKELAEQLNERKAFVQVLDEQGQEVAAIAKPPGTPDTYSPQELALRLHYEDRYTAATAIRYSPEDSTTWVLTQPHQDTVTQTGTANASVQMKIIMTAVVTLLLGVFVVLILLSFWYAQRFGSPMLHILERLDRLEKGIYNEPLDPYKRSITHTKSGKMRHSYRLYSEVIQSISQLAQRLHRNEQLQKQTEQMREEWIVGVTHDLKTPLSSLKGYSHMLAADQYQWSEEEVREFAVIMLDKSSYMDQLVNDLAMTYRLRSGGYTPELEPVELNHFMEEAVLLASQHPRYEPDSIQFEPCTQPLLIEIHKPFFQRIVDNLTANALLHNPPDTKLSIRINQLEEQDTRTVTIAFQDNGNGMDEELALRLFERYYRGTNTEASEMGSGLGMAVTKGLVEAMGGSIHVETAPGEGTTITLIWKIINENSRKK